jgi:hypothetical protein
LLLYSSIIALELTSYTGKKRRVVASSDEESDAEVTVSAEAAPAPSTSKSTKKDDKEKVKAPEPANGTVDKPKSKDKVKNIANGEGHVDKKPKKDGKRLFTHKAGVHWAITHVLGNTERSSKTKPAPKIASIFAAPSKKASSSTSRTESSTSNADKKKTDKGKAKAEDTEDIESISTSKVPQEKVTSATNSDEGGEISGVDENGNEEADDSAMESEEEQEQAAKLYVQVWSRVRWSLADSS